MNNEKRSRVCEPLQLFTLSHGNTYHSCANMGYCPAKRQSRIISLTFYLLLFSIFPLTHLNSASGALRTTLNPTSVCMQTRLATLLVTATHKPGAEKEHSWLRPPLSPASARVPARGLLPGRPGSTERYQSPDATPQRSPPGPGAGGAQPPPHSAPGSPRNGSARASRP